MAISRRDTLKGMASLAFLPLFSSLSIKKSMVMLSDEPDLNTHTIPKISEERFKTGILSLDEMLGGGFVPGSLNFIVGKPGTGKSSLIYRIFEENKPKILPTATTPSVASDTMALWRERGRTVGYFERDSETVILNVKDFVQELRDIRANNCKTGAASFLSFDVSSPLDRKALGITTEVGDPKTKPHNTMQWKMIADTILHLEGDTWGHCYITVVKARTGKMGRCKVAFSMTQGVYEIPMDEKNPLLEA